MKFSVRPDEDKQRLDKVLAARLPDISRSFLQSLCKHDKVLVNGSAEKSGYKLHWGDNIEVLYDISSIGSVPDIELPVLFEDKNLLVINKPAGVLTHALSKFKNEPSVASFLRQKTKEQVGAGDTRFGMVHRLDRLTSGVIVCAKNNETLKQLQKQFADRAVEKKYLAVVTGKPKYEKAVIDVPIERNPKAPATFRVGKRGKSAETSYKVIKNNKKYSLVELAPKTGRTHQLRVHMAYVGCPIVGDKLYNGEQAERLYLHAASLQIKLPSSSSNKTFRAPMPELFNELMI